MRDNNIVKLYSHARCPRAHAHACMQNKRMYNVCLRICVCRVWYERNEFRLSAATFVCNSLNNERRVRELNYLVI